MAKITDLLERWDSAPSMRLTRQAYEVHLTARDAARIQALAEIYPNVNVQNIITDLICASLDQIESALPYVPGPRVVSTDEFGDPIYEDIGPSHRFQQATRRHLRDIETDLDTSADEP